MFIVALTLARMAWLMLQYVTGGAWGLVIRRSCEAAARTLPLVLLMFLPIVIGINNLYPWAHADMVAADPLLQTQSAVPERALLPGPRRLLFRRLDVPLLVVQSLVGQGRSRRPRRGARQDEQHGGPGLLFWGFSVTFMSIDWILSVDPKWFSTIFGLLFMAGQGLTAMAFLITLMVLLSTGRPMSEVLTHRHLHDLGKFLLALVMVWAYFSFSQFLIIWAGNLPEEIPWYLTRLNHGWQYVGLLLVIGHFALPFALLLSRDLKRNFKLLASHRGLHSVHAPGGSLLADRARASARTASA